MKKVGLQSGDLRASNKITILNLIRREVCSRAHIAKQLGMSRPAVSSLVSELLQDGLIREVGKGDATNSGGKKPVMLDINSESLLNIAVYFNSEWFEVALVDFKSNVLLHSKCEMNLHDNYKYSFSEIVDEINNSIQKLELKLGKVSILACAIVVKGMVNTSEGLLTYSATLPEWRNIPVVHYFEEQ